MTKMSFLKMPIEAMFDKRLTKVDLSILGAVAYHDRSGSGRGCFASVATLAQLADVPITSAERSMKKLRDFKYLTVQKDRSDGRQRTYRIAYLNGNQPIPLKDEGKPQANDPQSWEKSPSEFENSSEEDQGFEGGNQRHKHIVRSDESYSDESAPFLQNDAPPEKKPSRERTFEERMGQYLREIEGAMKNMASGDRSGHASALYELLDGGSLQHGEPLYFWAERIMSELEYLNDQDKYDLANT